MSWEVRRALIEGQASVPGDKSIAHRALMVAALAPGTSVVRGAPDGADVEATSSCLKALGVEIRYEGGCVQVQAPRGLRAPQTDLYAANSGTTMRLLAGILAGQPFDSRLTGDPSLSRRPMERIVEPLSRLGARVRSHDGKPPLEVEGRKLVGSEIALPVSSAQVKSCVLLAGLLADGESAVSELLPTRDHTERLLRAVGIAVDSSDGRICLMGKQVPRPFALSVPGDFSSAAFLLSAGLLSGGSVSVRDVGLNPTRTRLLDVIERMGGRVLVTDEREEMGEPRATVAVSGSVTRPTTVEHDEVPLLIDELPLVALLATQAAGTTVISGAAELRVKESDRIRVVCRLLRAMGARVDELPDGLAVAGPTALQGATVDAGGDHRIAMLAAVAGSGAAGRTIVHGSEAARVSFPGFAATLRALGGRIDGP